MVLPFSYTPRVKMRLQIASLDEMGSNRLDSPSATTNAGAMILLNKASMDDEFMRKRPRI
jgi:hypothetical protein